MKENPPTNKSDYTGRGYFYPKELGRSLKEVAVEYMSLENQDLESRWFHSNKDADLYVWKDARGNIVKQQMSFLGTIIEWNILEGVRTGYFIEDESSQGIDRSPIIQFDSKPQLLSIEQGVEVISYIDGLSTHDKAQLVNNFTTSPVFDSYSVDEITKKFGLKNKTEGSLWRRLFKMLGLDKKAK